jgi:hypothetical protein
MDTRCPIRMIFSLGWDVNCLLRTKFLPQLAKHLCQGSKNVRGTRLNTCCIDVRCPSWTTSWWAADICFASDLACSVMKLHGDDRCLVFLLGSNLVGCWCANLAALCFWLMPFTMHRSDGFACVLCLEIGIREFGSVSSLLCTEWTKKKCP